MKRKSPPEAAAALALNVSGEAFFVDPDRIKDVYDGRAFRTSLERRLSADGSKAGRAKASSEVRSAAVREMQGYLRGERPNGLAAGPPSAP